MGSASASAKNSNSSPESAASSRRRDEGLTRLADRLRDESFDRRREPRAYDAVLSPASVDTGDTGFYSDVTGAIADTNDAE